MVNYYEVVQVLLRIEKLLHSLIQFQIKPILYTLTFFVFLFVGFKCLRGYRL